MKNSEFGAIIIAAEDNPKIESALPKEPGTKALWPILDKPMAGYLLKTMLECAPEGVAMAVGREDRALCEYLKSFAAVTPITLDLSECNVPRVIQSSGEWLKQFPYILALGYDLPFLEAETVRSFVRWHADSGADCSFLGDAPCALAFEPSRFTEAIGRVSGRRISDMAAFLNAAGLKTRTFALDGGETPVINNQTDLAEANARMRGAIVDKWMRKGVRMMDPNAVWIGPDAELEPGTSLMPGAQIWGNSFIGEGSVVGPYCILRNAVLGREVKLISNVIIEDSELRDFVTAGPFAYIRENSVLKERSFAGKFVEIKKTSVGIGSKVPHLSYMGDAVLGEGVNIGAGSITCNYDGEKKSRTVIGDRCFVGSDTMMVAPVKLGDDSITGAGSTITADVPAGALAVARERQKNLDGWALRKKRIETQ